MALDVELSEVRDFFARHPPFDELPPEVLDGLPRELSIRYYRRGSELYGLGDDNHHLYVVRSGAIEIRNDRGELVERAGEGATTGSITLTMGNPSTFAITAIEDTLALVMEATTFYELTRRHAGFAQFFDEQRASRMGLAVATQQISATGSAILKTHVRDLVRREQVYAPAEASIREAAQAMQEHHVSSLLVVDDARIVGILTDRDLRGRVLAAGRDPLGPVLDVVTPDPVTIDADALAFEALLMMVGRSIHHVPVLEGGRAIGIVTTTDLMRLEQANPVYLVGDIAKQDDVEGVARVASRLPEVVESLVRQDASAEDIGRVVTAVGDAVERRVIALAEAELEAQAGPAPAAYCWVTLGSRARQEQALAADQDTALILDDALPADGDAWFAQLAERVVAGLETVGYPRCRGDVMATNPRWRRPLSQWRGEFRTWLTEPTPEAILQASIFFDMRAVHGDATLYQTLARFLRANAPRSPKFLAHLAKQAVRNEPPLGFFRGFVLEKEGEHVDTLDIKRGGIGAVVELARVHALATGAEAVGTQARIAAAVSAGVMNARRGEDLRDAFEFISYVRLRHQAAQVRAGLPPDNHVQPDDLSTFDKRHLREAFGIVRSAQSTLASLYPSTYIS